ncbi:DUF7389 domain-containing protein [Natronosalvus halobius]|uniref:DUF7389 domain-containing protein n=1 Tax=Natronosalvus halobius TaxID=2953746 RepID=UPI00209EEC08|nr:hypothetical protein [Natronosalvus halobius]USZ71984.1 hypothetical protein NGM15_01355 [Natronosalvus halobius]
MSDEDSLEITVELTRGTSTDDRDKIRAKVSAGNVDELEHKVEQVRERLEQWAEDLREVQPSGETVRDHAALDEDQTTLEEGSA